MVLWTISSSWFWDNRMRTLGACIFEVGCEVDRQCNEWCSCISNTSCSMLPKRIEGRPFAFVLCNIRMKDEFVSKWQGIEILPAMRPYFTRPTAWEQSCVKSFLRSNISLMKSGIRLALWYIWQWLNVSTLLDTTQGSVHAWACIPLILTTSASAKRLQPTHSRFTLVPGLACKRDLWQLVWCDALIQF